MNDFGLVYPLWTDAHGPGGLLDRAVGEIGFDHLTVPVVTGATERFRFAVTDALHTFATAGGWHFPPELACYHGGPVRPRPARWFGKRDLLHHLRGFVADRNIPLVFRIDLRSVVSLVEHEPHLRTRNAWGDEVVSAGACPSNPDLRELLHGTLEDLQRYEPAGFQLVDWITDLPTLRTHCRPVAWHPLARTLLDICFCPACRQVATTAGIDPDHAARSVQVHIERLLAQPGDDDVLARLDNDTVVNSYRLARRADSAKWLCRLSEIHAARRRFLLCDPQTSEAFTALMPDDAPGIVLRSGPSHEPVNEDALLATLSGKRPPHGLALPVWRPFFDRADQLVRVVTETVRAGVTFFDFEGLDEAPDEAFTWLRQAIRYARRG